MATGRSPAHPQGASKPASPLADPEGSFEGVWCDVLLWLQKDPDTNAKVLLARLRSAHPGRFSGTRLRIQQPGVKDWRGVMAKRLVYAASDEPAVGQRSQGRLSPGRNRNQRPIFR